MAAIIFHTCLFLLINFFQVVVSIKLPCQPRPQVIPMKIGKMYYTEANGGADDVHIEVYRCSGGGENHPEAYRCVPKEIQEMQKEVIPYNNYPPTKIENFTYINHTSCVQKCVCDVPGHSKCISNDEEMPKCDDGEIWDRTSCRCDRTRQDCATSFRGSNGGISLTMFIVALAIEFIIVLIVVFLIMDVCKYRRHGKGLLYKTSQYVRHISAASNEGFKITTLKRGREATGSISFLYEVNNGNIPGGKPV